MVPSNTIQHKTREGCEWQGFHLDPTYRLSKPWKQVYPERHAFFSWLYKGLDNLRDPLMLAICNNPLTRRSKPSPPTL